MPYPASTELSRSRRPRKSDPENEEQYMKQDKQKRNWIIDAVLFGGFLVALWLDLTGLAVHQWLGIAVGALGRVSPGGALELGGGSNEPALRAHQQTIPPVLRGRRRPGSRICDHCRDRPGHLDLARSVSGELRRLAQHPRAGLRRDAGPGGWQDRAPLALDRQHGSPAHLPGARARLARSAWFSPCRLRPNWAGGTSCG